MTVMWWLSEAPPDPGGIGTLAANVGPVLGQRGRQLDLLVMCGGPEQSELDGLPVRRLPVREAFATDDHRALLRLRHDVAAHKRAVTPTVYHVHLCEPSPVLHLATLNIAPAPTVLTLHNEMFEKLSSHGDDTLLTRLAEQATVILAVSQGVSADFLARLPHLADRMVIAPNGVSVGSTPTEVPPLPIIAFAGRLVNQKGLDRLIRALPTVRSRVPAVQLIVAGDGPARASMQRLAKQLHCADVVQFVGQIDRAEVDAIFDSSRVVAMPSRHEGMPFVALEAGERGRMTVGTRIGGIDEVVVDGLTGTLVDQDGLDTDPTPLAEAIIVALTEPGRAEAAGAAARARIESHFSIEVCAEIHDLVYRIGDAVPTPRVSVIIPTWNAAAHIAQALATVTSQTFTDYEIIVVDDGSTDNTVEVVRSRFPEVVVLRQPHRGSGASRDAGMAICRGALIAHLDADDLWPADRLERLVDAFDAADVDAVFGSAVEFADHDAPPAAVISAGPQVVRMLTTAVVDRAAHRRVGPFPEDLFGDQIGWLASALGKGLRYRHIDEVVLERRIHANNNSLRFPFLTETARPAMLRAILRERRSREQADRP